MTEPIPRGRAMSKGIFVFENICLPMDTTAIENTVMELMTPIVRTSKPCSMSMSGFMMTPPPIPVSEPTVVAPIAIRKYST